MLKGSSSKEARRKLLEAATLHIGYGDLASAVLALLSLLALHYRLKGAIVLVWVFNVIGMLDVLNAFIQSIRYGVFNVPLGVGWLIVTLYVPALVVSGLMIFYLLLSKRTSLHE